MKPKPNMAANEVSNIANHHLENLYTPVQNAHLSTSVCSSLACTKWTYVSLILVYRFILNET